MRKRNQGEDENSALGLLGLEGTVESAADAWEYDAQLLRTLAVLSGTIPFNLLRKISWSVGETADMASFYMGRPLSPAVRARLRALLKERMQVEHETIENCRHASSEIVQLVPYFVGFAVLSLLLVN